MKRRSLVGLVSHPLIFLVLFTAFILFYTRRETFFFHIIQQLTTVEAEKFSIAIEFKDVKEIHNRRFQLKECAIEFFTSDGKTHFVSFHSDMVNMRIIFVFSISTLRLSS